MRARGNDRERGAVLVEAAFVLPVLFFIFLGFMELSLVIAGNSAGSNAARDGVRVAVLQYENADINGSPNNLAIKAAVDAKLGKMVKGTPTVTVQCIKADSEAVIGCTRAAGDSGVEVDRDLIQVTVTWTQLVVTPLVDSDHTETARATVQGAPDFSPDASPLAVYFDDPDQDGIATPVTVNEPAGTVDLTLHRSGDSIPSLTVSLGAGASSTAEPADYSLPSTVTFASGVDDVTVSVTIVNDNDIEVDEVLWVEMTPPLSVNPPTANAIIGQPHRVAVNIHSEDVDTTEPSPTTARYAESPTARDGRIDFVAVVFSEPVANPGSWSIANGGPAGASLGTPGFGGSSATVVIPVNGATVDTAGAFAVSATGVTDAFGNAFSGTINLTDAANPVLVSVTTTQPASGQVGLAQVGDRLNFNFSEPVSLPSAVGTLSLSNDNGGPGFDRLGIQNFVDIASTTGGDYTRPSTDAIVTSSIVGNQVRITIATCGDCGSRARTVLGTPTLGLAFVPWPTGPIGDDGLPPVLPTAALAALLEEILMRKFLVRRRDDDRGITIVMMALSLVALCAIGGMAMDGGAAYANRRQSQNAADSAALAGTIILDDIRTGDQTDESKILAAVTASLAENEITDFTCEIVQYDPSGTSYGSPYPCPTTDLADGTFNIDDAAGVRVDATKVHETSLVRVVGIDTVTSPATATATIQAAKGLERGAAPFMLCGNDDLHPHDGFAVPALTAIGGSYVVNPAAKYSASYTGELSGFDVGYPAELPGGPWYLIHDDNGSGADNGSDDDGGSIQGGGGTGVPGCGMGGSGFKGLVNTNLSYTIPGFWDTKTGQVEGPTEAVLRGPDGCIGGLDGCYIVVPIGAFGRGTGTNGELFNVRFGMFYLVEVGGGNGSHYVAIMEPGSINPITGQPVPNFVLAGGVGGGQVTDPTQPYFIKLAE